jgi:DNA-binding transcriptional ArsR family regulator
MFIGTGGILADSTVAIQRLNEQLPPTAMPGMTTVVLDLGGMTATPGPLRELILTLGQRIKGGVYGETRLIVATPDPALAELVDLLAGAHGLSLYLAESSAEQDVLNARPAGQLTETERETLAGLMAVGGATTIGSFAAHIDVEPTAVNNRFAKLERNGYVHRQKRARRAGDVYYDPRKPVDDRLEVPPRDALKVRGVETDPYDREPLRLEGEAADRAAEILKKRNPDKS